MLHKTRGIVIKQVKFRETSLIVTIYTEEFGMRSYIVNGIRSAKSKKSAAAFSPMSLLDLVVYNKEGADVQRISEWKRSSNLINMYTDIRKSSVALFISEVLFKSIRDSHQTDGTFEFIFHSMEWLENAEKGFSTFHLQFLVKLAKFLGFGVENYADNPKFEFFKSLEKQNYGKVVSLGRDDQFLHLDNLMLYYQEHIEGFGNVKSLPVLREVFSN